MGEPLLELERLTVHYVSARGRRVVPAVEDVSLGLGVGETLGIVGESGSGKTTLALSILRLLPPAAQVVSGAIRFEGGDLLRKSDAEMRAIRGKRIAMILQDPMVSLNPLLTVGDQVGEPLRVHERASRRSAWSRAGELLRSVRIPAAESRLAEYPHQMSGGMRQRIVGAMAISCRPGLLIADEPTTSLDVTIQSQYLSLLRELQVAYGLSLIFITHNLGIVARMCDRIAVMYAGRIVESGPVRTIFNAAAHPYTQALLESIPRIRDDGGELAPGARRLAAIDGQPPDLATLPPGCAFHPRCGHVMERCLIERPPELDLGGRHGARCWLVAEPAAPGAHR
jgi:oligopeptide/dipeptide ABC transporter ATP-binding protein